MKNNNLFPKFALSTDFSTAVPTKWDDVKALMKSAQVKNICLQLQQLDPNLTDYGKQKEALKKKLPQLMVHACGFEDNHRNSHNAWWNGCVCLDYDHLTEVEIEAIRTTEPPCPGIILAGRSCGGKGVFLIVEVPHADFLAMRTTLQAVHDAYTHALKVKHGLDISDKLDILTDLARCRYLPTYDYIWWDAVEDFQSEDDQEAPYQSMYGEVIQTCAALDTNIPEGSSAQQAYNSYAAKVKTLTDNPLVMLKYLPDLGLTEKQRKDIISWTEKNVQTKQKQAIPINLYQQPIDVEALPLPFRALPKVMQVLLKRYPATWQRSAFFCTLPAFSAACGQLTQENGKPLVFQVALFGEHQTGKTEFSAKPATIIQDYIARDDNQRRYNIRKAEDNRDIDEKKLSPPCVIPFINTSTPQVMKYLRFAKEQTIMAYEGDISSSLAGKDCAFLNLKYLLRQGFDGETVIMDYKDRESFQGSVKARLSSLVVGTPTAIFNYFNPQSTAEGNSRRVIFVQHEGIMKPLNIKKFTTDELEFVHAELDRLQNLSQTTVYHQKIENAAANWRTKIQQLANKDEILHRAAHTPTEMYKRTAYLMWALFDFDEKKIKNCCELAELVAEYQYRQYINLTYAEQKEEKKKWQQKLPPTTQQQQEDFNKQMLEDMPNIFTKQDIVNYRLEKQYPHNPKSYHNLTRWKKAGLIIQLEDKSFQKI